jgi:ATP-dependent 26S proteasome regulatory subunit
MGKTDSKERRQEVENRNQWEAQRTSEVGDSVANNLQGRSALSKRAADSTKSDPFMSNVMNPTPDSIATIANEKSELQNELEGKSSEEPPSQPVHNENYERAANRVSELIAKAGSGSQFEGETLGIGGLDDVLAQVKRRVWIPLAAPPTLLAELGIHPVRGLLLYGRPGCGKTLLARTLGKILSPIRPITVVSGPEILDKFVGSSEKVSCNYDDGYMAFQLDKIIC